MVGEMVVDGGWNGVWMVGGIGVDGRLKIGGTGVNEVGRMVELV